MRCNSGTFSNLCSLTAMTEHTICTTKPVLRQTGIYWLCRSWLPVVMGDDLVWLPRLGWSCISKGKAYENWKLAVTGGDLSMGLEYVGKTDEVIGKES